MLNQQQTSLRLQRLQRLLEWEGSRSDTRHVTCISLQITPPTFSASVSMATKGSSMGRYEWNVCY